MLALLPLACRTAMSMVAEPLPPNGAIQSKVHWMRPDEVWVALVAGLPLSETPVPGFMSWPLSTTTLKPPLVGLALVWMLMVMLYMAPAM